MRTFHTLSTNVTRILLLIFLVTFCQVFNQLNAIPVPDEIELAPAGASNTPGNGVPPTTVTETEAATEKLVSLKLTVTEGALNPVAVDIISHESKLLAFLRGLPYGKIAAGALVAGFTIYGGVETSKDQGIPVMTGIAVVGAETAVTVAVDIGVSIGTTAMLAGVLGAAVAGPIGMIAGLIISTMLQVVLDDLVNMLFQDLKDTMTMLCMILYHQRTVPAGKTAESEYFAPQYLAFKFPSTSIRDWQHFVYTVNKGAPISLAHLSAYVRFDCLDSNPNWYLYNEAFVEACFWENVVVFGILFPDKNKTVGTYLYPKLSPGQIVFSEKRKAPAGVNYMTLALYDEGCDQVAVMKTYRVNEKVVCGGVKFYASPDDKLIPEDLIDPKYKTAAGTVDFFLPQIGAWTFQVKTIGEMCWVPGKVAAPSQDQQHMQLYNGIVVGDCSSPTSRFKYDPAGKTIQNYDGSYWSYDTSRFMISTVNEAPAESERPYFYADIASETLGVAAFMTDPRNTGTGWRAVMGIFSLSTYCSAVNLLSFGHLCKPKYVYMCVGDLARPLFGEADLSVPSTAASVAKSLEVEGLNHLGGDEHPDNADKINDIHSKCLNYYMIIPTIDRKAPTTTPVGDSKKVEKPVRPVGQ